MARHRKKIAISCMFIPTPHCLPNAPSGDCALVDLGGIERRREPPFLTIIASTLSHLRPADSGRAMTPDEPAVRVFAEDLVDEKILRRDDVAFHPENFGDVSDAARSVTQARSLHDDVDRRAHHLLDRLRWEAEAAHR